MQLLPQTYDQKYMYLIDCQWYDQSELETLWELCLDDIILTNNWLSDLIEFSK